MGGLIFHLTGRIPSEGEEVETGPIRLTVLEADARKIKKVRITKPLEKAEETEE